MKNYLLTLLMIIVCVAIGALLLIGATLANGQGTQRAANAVLNETYVPMLTYTNQDVHQANVSDKIWFDSLNYSDWVVVASDNEFPVSVSLVDNNNNVLSSGTVDHLHDFIVGPAQLQYMGTVRVIADNEIWQMVVIHRTA